MRSRVHPKYKTKYRVSNWAEYDRALVHLIVDSTGLSIIGDRLRARHSKAQEAETLIACSILNGMTALGRPASYAIGA